MYIHVLPNSSRHYLHLVLKPYLLVLNNIVKIYTENSGMNCFWIIDINSKEVLDRLHETSRARCFDSYNFATLYIPHDALKAII